MATIRINRLRARYSESDVALVLKQPEPTYIEILFAMLLKRPPDEPSLTHYSRLGRTSPRKRRAVFLDIYNSDEAKDMAVGVGGLSALALASEESIRPPRVFISAKEIVPDDRSLGPLAQRFRPQLRSPADKRWAREAMQLSKHAPLAVAYEVAARSGQGTFLKISDVGMIDPQLRDDDVPRLYAYRSLVHGRYAPSRRTFGEDDFVGLAGDDGDPDFIIRAYESLLGRAPDVFGFLEGLIALRNGGTDRARFARALAESEEGLKRDLRIQEAQPALANPKMFGDSA